jgi:DNA polymerase III epsilon subunit-like protein
MAERITGIRTADVAGLPPLADFWPDVKDVMAAADRLVAHNLTYDLQVLRFEAERLGDDLPVPDDLLCTVEATIHYRGFRLSLTRLYEHLFGETFVDAHRAKSDVMALMRCYRALVERGDA